MLNAMNDRTELGDFVPFSLTFVTCNKRLGTGGEKITLERAQLVGGGNSKAKKSNPNHFEHYTRNIKAVDGDRIMKVHVLLVTRFNGDKVIL